MNTVVSLLLMLINSDFSCSSQRDIAIALVMLANSPKMLTASHVAELANTSTRLVNKLCSSLGYRNFTALKTDLESTCEIRRRQMALHYKKTDIAALERSIAHHSEEPFEIDRFRKEASSLIELIYASSRTIILGAAFPQALFLHFEEDMLMMGKLAYAVPIIRHLNLPDQLDQNDLLLFVSITGRIFSYYPDEFQSLAQCPCKVACICGCGADIDRSLVNARLTLPFTDDDESANTVLLETSRYLKHQYYAKHYQG